MIDLTHINIDSVKIVLTDADGVRGTLTRNHLGQWQVEGIVYPRFVKLMSHIDDFIAVNNKK